MSVSCCLHHALAIGKTPDDTWGAQIALIPDVCPSPNVCGQPHNCRERNAEFLRMQYRMKRDREAMLRRRGGG